eukprot:TRINITY_DN62964_c0_g1_i1.p2 TRINITY_DN62964_c0_g1~~TRINITY_DN62964_c0_g1_i1.p2  ORF type:complete len:284 (+),score=99.03 TRINITY_DN62964_c0_g1_i1:64-852(+)
MAEASPAVRADFCIARRPVKDFEPPQSEEALFQTASLLEQLGNGAEMRACVARLVQQSSVLGFRTLDLLSRAFKLTQEGYRQSLRRLRADERDEVYRVDVIAKCEGNIRATSHEALAALATSREKLPPVSDDPTVHVLLHTLIGDYNRYLCEVEQDDSPRLKADAAYTEAVSIATTHLAPEHPLRLGLSLNRSILAYEIMKSPDQGVAIARQAFGCSQSVSTTPNADRVHAKLVLDKLRENVSMWTQDEADPPEDDHIPKKL